MCGAEEVSGGRRNLALECRSPRHDCALSAKRVLAALWSITATGNKRLGRSIRKQVQLRGRGSIPYLFVGCLELQ